jgi:hypothetical protein
MVMVEDLGVLQEQMKSSARSTRRYSVHVSKHCGWTSGDDRHTSGYHADWKDTKKGEWKIPSALQARIKNHGKPKTGGQQDNKKDDEEKNGDTKASVNGLFGPEMVEKFRNFSRDTDDPTSLQIDEMFAKFLAYAGKE